jgi:hypothetical protein
MSAVRSANGNINGAGKGSSFGDSSFYSAYRRKQATISGQLGKQGAGGVVQLNSIATTQKPLLGNYLKQKGYECAINDIVLAKNSNGFM